MKQRGFTFSSDKPIRCRRCLIYQQRYQNRTFSSQKIPQAFRSQIYRQKRHFGLFWANLRVQGTRENRGILALFERIWLLFGSFWQVTSGNADRCGYLAPPVFQVLAPLMCEKPSHLYCHSENENLFPFPYYLLCQYSIFKSIQPKYSENTHESSQKE